MAYGRSVAPARVMSLCSRNILGKAGHGTVVTSYFVERFESWTILIKSERAKFSEGIGSAVDIVEHGKKYTLGNLRECKK